MSGLDLRIYEILRNAGVRAPGAPQQATGLMSVPSGPTGLLSPNTAPAPAGPVPDVVQGGSPAPDFIPAMHNGQPFNLGAFLRAAGITLLSTPAGQSANVGQAVATGIQQSQFRGQMAEAQHVAAQLERHYPNGAPLHVLETVYQHGVATNNPFIVKGLQQEIQTRIETAKLAAANKLAQGEIVYDQHGNAYRSVVTPAGQQVTVPVTITGPHGRPVQLSRGPTQASVAPEKLDWYPDNTGHEVYGGFVADQAGVHFQPAEMNGKPMTRPAGAGGMKGVTPQMKVASQQFAQDYADVTKYAPDALKPDLLGKARELVAGGDNNSARMTLAGSPEYVAYNAARNRGAELIASLSAGRKSNFLIQLIRDSYFPGVNDPVGSASYRTKMQRLGQLNEMLQRFYNPDTPESERQQIKARIGAMVSATLPDQIDPETGQSVRSEFTGASSPPQSSGVDLGAYQKATGGGS